MPPSSRFEPSAIKNKIKREDVAAKNKKAKNQQKLQKRLAQAKVEASDPVAKKVRYHLHSYTIHELIEMVIILETSGGEHSPHPGQYS